MLLRCNKGHCLAFSVPGSYKYWSSSIVRVCRVTCTLLSTISPITHANVTNLLCFLTLVLQSIPCDLQYSRLWTKCRIATCKLQSHRTLCYLNEPRCAYQCLDCSLTLEPHECLESFASRGQHSFWRGTDYAAELQTHSNSSRLRTWYVEHCSLLKPGQTWRIIHVMSLPEL